MKNKSFLKKHKRKIIYGVLYIIGFVIVMLVCLLIVLILFSGLFYKSVSLDNMQLVLSEKGKYVSILMLISFFALCSLSIFWFFVWRKKDRKKSSINRIEDKSFGSANFLANESDDLPEKERSDLTEFNKYFNPDTKDCGWVVKSKYNNKENKTHHWVSSCDKNGHHCLVIGATSSGKTQKTILQSISHNASKPDLENKPSMVIFDPKGEITDLQIGFLKENGYKTLIFNLRDTFKSSCWNPLYLASKTYFDAKLLEKQLEQKRKKLLAQKEEIEFNISNFGNELDSAEMENFNLDLINVDNQIYELETERSEVIQKEAMCNEIIKDVAITLYNEGETKEAFWPRQAQAALVFAYYWNLETIEKEFFEDKTYEEIDVEKLKEAYSKINLPSIAQQLSNIKDIKKYFDFVNSITNFEIKTKYLNLHSYKEGSPVFSNPDTTLGNIMSNVACGLEQYKQSTIQNITMTSEIILDELTTQKQPIALFIVVPDEKETSYKFATLLVDQIYKSNIGLAGKLPNQKLPRPLMFFLDEFGNIPTIPKFDTMITVSRSRRIFFNIAIQGFNQIDTKYGKDQAKTIIENMLLHIYVSSTDQETIKYYQNRAGNYTAYKITSSQNTANTKNGVSESTSIDKKELLTLEDVKNNPKDMLLVFYQNLDVAWIKTDYYYKCNDLLEYSNIKLNDVFKDIRIFEFKNYSFDIALWWEKYYVKFKEDNKYWIALNQIKKEVNSTKLIELYKTIISSPEFNEDDLKQVDAEKINIIKKEIENEKRNNNNDNEPEKYFDDDIKNCNNNYNNDDVRSKLKGSNKHRNYKEKDWDRYK